MLVVRLLVAILVMAVPLGAADPIPIDRGLTIGDGDGDGYPEASGHAVGLGPCGCACPVVGAGVQADVAGQSVFVYGATILVVCGTGAWSDADPGEVDADGHPDVRPIVYTWP